MSEQNDPTGKLIDLAKLRLRFDDDEELLTEIFRVFIDEVPGRQAGIRAAFTAGDLARLTHMAHSLKGVAATMFAEPLRQAAFDLEMASRAANHEQADRLVGRVLDLLGQTVAFLEKEA